MSIKILLNRIYLFDEMSVRYTMVGFIEHIFLFILSDWKYFENKKKTFFSAFPKSSENSICSFERWKNWNLLFFLRESNGQMVWSVKYENESHHKPNQSEIVYFSNNFWWPLNTVSDIFDRKFGVFIKLYMKSLKQKE